MKAYLRALAKRTPSSSSRRLLVLELWGLGDTTLALPFLRAAAARHEVTLLAQARASALLRRFAPTIDCIPVKAPWTSFRGKYKLTSWPWRDLRRVTAELRIRDFDVAVSARRDPRDHLWLKLSGAPRRMGFAHRASSWLLTDPLAAPVRQHRADAWNALAASLGFEIPPQAGGRLSPPNDRLIVVHLGSGHPNRTWPRDRWTRVVDHLRERDWDVVVLDDSLRDLDRLIDTIAPARAFLGNDSGPGHLAAFLGVPTFTVFGPQLPGLFAPRHPAAAWREGGPCTYKPCWDSCRYSEPRCLLAVDTEGTIQRIDAWLGGLETAA